MASQIISNVESGTVMVNGSPRLIKYAPIAAASNGDNTIVAAVAAKKIRVLNVTLISGGTVTVRFESAAGGTALTGQIALVAQTGFAPGFDLHGHFETVAGELLNLELSAAVAVAGWLSYIEV